MFTRSTSGGRMHDSSLNLQQQREEQQRNPKPPTCSTSGGRMRGTRSLMCLRMRSATCKARQGGCREQAAISGVHGAGCHELRARPEWSAACPLSPNIQQICRCTSPSSCNCNRALPAADQATALPPLLMPRPAARTCSRCCRTFWLSCFMRALALMRFSFSRLQGWPGGLKQ